MRENRWAMNGGEMSGTLTTVTSADLWNSCMYVLMPVTWTVASNHLPTGVDHAWMDIIYDKELMERCAERALWSDSA